MRRPFQPERFPARETVMAAYEMREQGALVQDIANALGENRKTVNTWLAHPERYDPFIDEVALERSMAGDEKVYFHLTIYEREEFFKRVVARMEKDPYDPKIHRTPGTYNVGTRIPYWGHELADSLHIHRDQFARTLANYRRLLAEQAA